MDLGLTGKRAIVCASSQGLGRACAMARSRVTWVKALIAPSRAAISASTRSMRVCTAIVWAAFMASTPVRSRRARRDRPAGRHRAPYRGAVSAERDMAAMRRVIAMTGASGEQNFLSVAKLFGARHILEKPFGADQIRRLVNYTLAH